MEGIWLSETPKLREISILKKLNGKYGTFESQNLLSIISLNLPIQTGLMVQMLKIVPPPSLRFTHWGEH